LFPTAVKVVVIPKDAQGAKGCILSGQEGAKSSELVDQPPCLLIWQSRDLRRGLAPRAALGFDATLSDRGLGPGRVDPPLGLPTGGGHSPNGDSFRGSRSGDRDGRRDLSRAFAGLQVCGRGCGRGEGRGGSQREGGRSGTLRPRFDRRARGRGSSAMTQEEQGQQHTRDEYQRREPQIHPGRDHGGLTSF